MHSINTYSNDLPSRAYLMALSEQARHKQTLVRQPLLGELTAEPMGPTTFDPTADIQKVYRYVVGRDHGKPQPASDTELKESLQDPFAELVLKKGKFPLTTEEVLLAFHHTENEPNGLESLKIFVIAEGGQIPWSETTKNVNRSARYVFAMQIKGGIGPDVMISTDTDTRSEDPFLQLMAWDPKNRAYNFYQRLKKFWIWSGNSFDALPPATRGKGPFSGHTNGGPIMKELKLPWQHWHSMSAVISKSALDPEDPIQTSPFFDSKQGGETFEKLTRNGIHEWNRSRIAQALGSDRIKNPEYLFRQILQTTNVNLTSAIESKVSEEPTSVVSLPSSFFANIEGLSAVDVDPSIQRITVPGSIYLKSLKEFNFRLQSRGVRIPGDTHFAFFVPEVAFEDNDLLEKMVRSNILTARVAACLLMVDFSNPVYSTSRASLMQYVPQTLLKGDKEDFEKSFVTAVEQSSKHTDPKTPEGEFYSYWKIGANGWKEKFEELIVNHFKAAKELCQSQEGFNRMVKLAEERRFKFKKTPQFEFDLTFAANDISS